MRLIPGLRAPAGGRLDKGSSQRQLVPCLLGPNPQKTVLLVVESQPPIAELFPQDPILFAETLNVVLLLFG